MGPTVTDETAEIDVWAMENWVCLGEEVPLSWRI